MNAQNYTINIRPGWGISPVVKVSQGDVGRPLAFVLMDGQDALTIATGTTVTIKGTKPSTLGFTQACELSGNTASVETTATMTQEAGAVQAELILTQGTTVIGSANFVVYVEPAAHPEGTTDGDAETARDLMTRAEQAVEQAEAAAESASDSAASIAQAGIDASTATSGQVPTANGSGGWNWADQEGGGTSDDIENASSVSGSTVSDALNSLSDEIANLEGGAPTPAATVAGMVDTTKIYLYTGSETGYNAGHWYYYSGGQWVDGGVYGEAASMSAGVKAALLACFRNVAWIGDDGQDYYDALYNELYPSASLVSITAVYTQSGTVYDTASLDDLKPDLVVTANYSDGTSETISDYTLSGTLATGTSTITVTYGGKTTTFDVVVSSDVDEPIVIDDRTYVSGYINDNGEIASLGSNYTGNMYIPITGNIIIDFTDNRNDVQTVRIAEYDSTKTFIKRSYLAVTNIGGAAGFVLDTNTAYVRVGFVTSLPESVFSNFEVMRNTGVSNYLMYEFGTIDTSGNDAESSQRVRSGFIQVLEGTSAFNILYATASGSKALLRLYDANKVYYNSSPQAVAVSNQNTSSDAAYVRLVFGLTSGTITNVDDSVIEIDGTIYRLKEGAIS